MIRFTPQEIKQGYAVIAKPKKYAVRVLSKSGLFVTSNNQSAPLDAQNIGDAVHNLEQSGPIHTPPIQQPPRPPAKGGDH